MRTTPVINRIGFFIPEFPGQTHAFFMRERVELTKLGIETELISTRKPVGGFANHVWAEQAMEQTAYLFPLTIGQIFSSLKIILLTGPRVWLRCLMVIFGDSDMGLKDRVRMFAMLLAGAFLISICRRKGLRHIHVHSCANSANIVMFTRLLGGPTYSMTLHGPLSYYGTNQARKWGYAAFCIVVTNDLMEEVKGSLKHVTLPAIYLAPMGVDTDFFKRSTAYVPVQSDNAIKLVSCGRLNRGKAHDDLIRVVAKLKQKGMNVQLNICGATDSAPDAKKYFDELKNLRSELGVEDRVKFLGSISENRVKEELESAHFFCLASLNEAIGVATMEAMAMEVPVIVTRHPGVGELVNDGVNGILVQPRAPDQFVEAIMSLVNSHEKVISMVRNGRIKIIQHFHSGISATQIANGLKVVAR